MPVSFVKFNIVRVIRPMSRRLGQSGMVVNAGDRWVDVLFESYALPERFSNAEVVADGKGCRHSVKPNTCDLCPGCKNILED